MTYDDEPDNFLNSEEIQRANQETTPAEPATPTISFNTPGNTPAQGKPRRRGHRVLAWLILIIILVAAGASLYYFLPNVTDAQATGYIAGVERQGIIFKTGESRLYPLPDSIAPGPAPRIESDYTTYSILNDSLFDRLQKYQATRMPVTITYSSSRAALPWRGSTPRIITAVSPAPTPRYLAP